MREDDAKLEPSESVPPDRLAQAPREGSGAGLIAWVVAGLVIAVGGGLYFKSKKAEPARPSGVIGSVVGALDSAGHVTGAKRVREACAAANDCGCRQATARAALDANLHAEALAVLAGDATCAKQDGSRDLESEALARAGRCPEAISLAAERIKAGKAPHSHYALAHCAYATGDAVMAGTEAAVAAEEGRGGAAQLLLGLIQYRAGNWAQAKIAFEKMLALDPDDLDAVYNLALIAQNQNRYRDAREGYLKVLKLSPRHTDARFNLGLLTHSVGAVEEAKHNLEELQKIAPPGDDRVSRLQAVLATPAPPPHANPVVAPPEMSAPPPAPSR
jgi:tetratricopeptide (TPR) repeat protein